MTAYSTTIIISLLSLPRQSPRDPLWTLEVCSCIAYSDDLVGLSPIFRPQVPSRHHPPSHPSSSRALGDSAVTRVAHHTSQYYHYHAPIPSSLVRSRNSSHVSFVNSAFEPLLLSSLFRHHQEEVNSIFCRQYHSHSRPYFPLILCNLHLSFLQTLLLEIFEDLTNAFRFIHRLQRVAWCGVE